MFGKKIIPTPVYFAAVILVSLLSPSRIARAAEAQVHTSNPSFVTRVAPGESLPISVKLTNFGGDQRADVTITYRILDKSGAAVLTSTETVAVETTASFTKVIHIPQNFAPGTYTAESSIEYLGQKVPATSSYEFTVEQKIAGFFLSSLLFYGGITLVVGIIFAVLTRMFIKRRTAGRFAYYEYPEIPEDKRVFYEIISDTIMQMRYHVGDRALDIAKSIEGLIVNEGNGRIMEINKNPDQIIALLVSKYEKLLGQKISFELHKHGEKVKSYQPAAGKNFMVIRKR